MPSLRLPTCVPLYVSCGLVLWGWMGGAPLSVQADDWPQWGGPQRDCVWRETGIVDKLPAEKGELLPRVWSAKLGEGYSGPAVAAGKVFITDYVDRDSNRPRERVFCLDAESGAKLWSHEYPVRYTISYPAGPRATPVVDADRVYTIGATGKMFCLATESGKVLWEKDFQTDYRTELPTWGMAAAPLVDGEQLITLVGGANGATVVSFDKLTGRELWTAIDDKEIGYAPPMIFPFGDRRDLIIWHPHAVTALDPSTGKEHWNVPFTVKAGLTVPTPKREGNRLFFTSFYNGSLMLDISPTEPGAKVLWKGKSDSEINTDGLHSIMPTPVFTKTHIYGVCSYGQLRCLDAATGKRVWETRAATGEGRWWNAFLIPNGDRVFLHNEQGELIIARLSPKGYEELSRATLIEPTRPVARRMTIWSHPAFAMQSVFARNDQEIVRVNLSAKEAVSKAEK